jgi:iron complex outermembrane receptor protein
MRALHLGLLLSAATGGLSVPLLAQAVPEPTVTETAGNTSDEIVVTARRRVEALQSVPIAITAVSGTQLEARGVRSAEDLRTLSPSLNVGGQARDNGNFYLRGQTPGVIQTGQRNFTSVATYFADVPTNVAGPGMFFDLANVQVLKGPQGTLFGRNTTGGAILFEPQRPTFECEGNGQFSYGNFNLTQFEGVINAPLVADKVALRLAGIVSRRDGFTRSVVTGQELDERNFEGFRASLLITPGSRFENLTIFDYRARDNAGSGNVLRQINPAAPFGAVPTPPALAPLLGLAPGTSVPIPLRAGGTVPVGCLSASLPGCPTGPFGGAVAGFRTAFNGGNFADPANGGFALMATTARMNSVLADQIARGPRQTSIDRMLRNRAEDWGITNRTTFELTENITLKNIIAFRSSRANQSVDFDGSSLQTIDILYRFDDKWQIGQQQFTEEFQIQGRIPSANIDYLVGYFHENSKPGFEQDLGALQFGSLSNRTPTNNDTSNAVFGHFEWQPIPLIGVSGGIRQTWDRREAGLSVFNAAGACTQFVPGTTIIQCPIDYSAEFSALTYDATITLKPSDTVLGYGSYRRGFKSGGFTLPAPTGFETFQPETVDSFEIGLKAEWDIGIPLRTTIALFYDDYKDVQTASPALIAGAIVSVVQNIGSQTNKGVELEFGLTPARGLNLGGFFSYVSATSDLDIVSPTGQLIVVKGRQIPFTPEFKWGFNGTYVVPVGTSELAMSADYSWQSVQNTNDVAAPINTYPSYGLLNARIELRNVIREGIDFSVFGTNLTNNTYILGGYPLATQLGFESALYGEPRMYGASVRVRFGAR